MNEILCVIRWIRGSNVTPVSKEAVSRFRLLEGADRGSCADRQVSASLAGWVESLWNTARVTFTIGSWVCARWLLREALQIVVSQNSCMHSAVRWSASRFLWMRLNEHQSIQEERRMTNAALLCLLTILSLSYVHRVVWCAPLDTAATVHVSVNVFLSQIKPPIRQTDRRTGSTS